MTMDALLCALFDQPAHALAMPMATWLSSSRRFTAFVTSYQSKIRKKLRAAQDAETVRDLQLELETAYLLLRERSLSLEYEPQPKQQGRSPDFALSFTTSMLCMLEVTRLRAAQQKLPPSQSHELSASPFASERFAGLLCSKLGQLMPQHRNLVLLGLEPAMLRPDDLNAAMLRIQQRAESNDAAMLRRAGLRDRSDFFQHYLRLSAVLVRSMPLHSNIDVLLWENPQAKYPLPGKLRSALLRGHML